MVMLYKRRMKGWMGCGGDCWNGVGKAGRGGRVVGEEIGTCGEEPGIWDGRGFNNGRHGDKGCFFTSRALLLNTCH